jgi:alkanesulfonate monooxygenase SsuD/methylene tetrahydromethanopterin reductase-like flavin-dependent oxidoreductase (luciferase family)
MIFATILDEGEKLTEELLGSIELKAEGAANRKIVCESLAESVHATSPGQGRAIDRRASRLSQRAAKTACAEAAKHYEENMKMFGELRLVRALTDEQIAAIRDPQLAATTKLPSIEDAVKAGGFLTGTPADIIEQLKAVEKRYPGVDRVVCATPLGTPLRSSWKTWIDSQRRSCPPSKRPR